jgi:hypothetical protein
MSEKKVISLIAAALVLLVVYPILVEALWNWLMPMIFNLRTVTYWQAVGLVVLGHALFGGTNSK